MSEWRRCKRDLDNEFPPDSFLILDCGFRPSQTSYHDDGDGAEGDCILVNRSYQVVRNKKWPTGTDNLWDKDYVLKHSEPDHSEFAMKLDELLT